MKIKYMIFSSYSFYLHVFLGTCELFVIKSFHFVVFSLPLPPLTLNNLNLTFQTYLYVDDSELAWKFFYDGNDIFKCD
jgi:hypothetical protein